MADQRRFHEDFQCDDIKIVREWKQEHGNEHKNIWERLDKMDERSRTMRDMVIEIKTKMVILTGLASMLGAVLGQMLMRLFPKVP